MHFASLFAVLLATWLLLSGQMTWLHLGSGIAACVLITYLAVRAGIAGRKPMPFRATATMLRYWPWLLYKILMANLDVAYRVWHPRLPIAPRLLKVPLDTRTDLGAATYANSITLTPGTVTVSVGKRELLVHALTEEGARELLDGEMQTRVKALERTP
ncbi:MAG: Na+/H+ antiporter subunit E [Pseudomonadota bacterium]|nr:MAG: Na+/H+ antiporter subunit E [Pseudomonadota bacterium]